MAALEWGRCVASFLLTGIVLTGAVALATPANAMEDPDWQELAECESGSKPGTNTGNGYYGLYQFDHRTWVANGGGQYSENADGATAQQQTEVAKRVHDARGLSPWPRCGQRLKNAGGANAGPAAKNPQQRDAAPRKSHGPKPLAARVEPRPASGSPYVVGPGDTLGGIAAKYQLHGGWKQLYERNRAVIPDPNVIFPRQVITVS